MLTESVVLGLLAATFKYGNMRFLSNLKVRLFILPIGAFLLEVACEVIVARDLFGWRAGLNAFYLVVQIIVYTLLVIFCYYNNDRKVFYIILAGILLNFAVIAANDGMMPVDPAGALERGYVGEVRRLEDGQVAGHALLDPERTRLAFLGDVLHVPPPYPHPKTVSAGDILLSVGVFLLIYQTKNRE